MISCYIHRYRVLFALFLFVLNEEKAAKQMCWCICEPMYRGPSRGPCIGSIYPTLLGFGGIQAIILSIKMYVYHKGMVTDNHFLGTGALPSQLRWTRVITGCYHEEMQQGELNKEEP